MTPWVMRQLLRDGALYNLLRRYCSLLSACWQVAIDAVMLVTTVYQCMLVCLFELFPPAEPNDESGANVDASVSNHFAIVKMVTY